MTVTQIITATDLEQMSSDARYELYRGVLQEMSPSSIDSSVIAMRIGILLGAYIYQHELGVISGENGGYLIEQDPDTVIAPDIGFVRRERLELWPGRRGFFPGIPDLAIEVISPTDKSGDIQRKRAIYDRIGIPLVWWIDPAKRLATIQQPGRPNIRLTADDVLDGTEIVPGFSLSLAKIFDTVG